MRPFPVVRKRLAKIEPAWQQTAWALLGGCSGACITSKSLMRMEPTRSLRLTWQTEASSLSVMPARVPFAYVAPVVAKSFDAEMADSVLTEKVLPHDLHFHLWISGGHVKRAPCSRSWPIRILGTSWVYLQAQAPPSSLAMRALSFSESSRFFAMPISSTRCSIIESGPSASRCPCLATCIVGGGPDTFGPFSGQSWSNRV
jgi:hypothetical protein